MDIKEFINEGKTLQNQDVEEVKKVKTKTQITYETVIQNDSDFVIERKTSTTDKMLVCILSQGLVYIKDCKSGKLTNNLKEKEIVNFLSECPMDKYPTTLKYKIKDGCTRLSEYFNWAIKHLPEAKELASHKLFYNLKSPDFWAIPRDNITKDVIKDLVWCKNFLEQMNVTYNWNSYLNSCYKWLKGCESIGINKDKIKYNIENFRIVGLDIITSAVRKTGVNYFTETISLGNLEFNNFMNYLRQLKTVEFLAINVNCYETCFNLKEYYDYLNMQLDMYGKIKEKYPSNWLSTLKIMQSKYSIWKQMHKDEKFLNENKKIKHLEYEDKDYCIIVPTKSSEIIDEGAHLGHCVGSYVDRIISGQTSIVFMRKPDKKEESLVTIEVRNNQVCQYRGYADRNVTEEEFAFIQKWSKEKNLELLLMK